MRDSVRRSRASLTALTLALSVVALCASGCASSAPVSAPTGIDELVIPTPSPRPADFVAGIDNPWLAWKPGARTTYLQTSNVGELSRDVTVTISSATTPVAGLDATTVTTTSGDDGDTVDWFAQDRRGNVWWLGREGAWTAGEAGAEAGLWMPAEPRVGDGFRLALQPGVVEDRAVVGNADPSASGDLDGEVRIDVRSALEPAVLTERTYDEGRGLVSEVRAGVTDGGYLRTLQGDN